MDLMQTIYVEVDDNDEPLDSPGYQCQICKVVRAEPPAPTGRLLLGLKSNGHSVDAYASKPFVSKLTNQREASQWGSMGSEQRLTLRNTLHRWEGKDYRATLNTAPAMNNGVAFYVSRLVELNAASKRRCA